MKTETAEKICNNLQMAAGQKMELETGRLESYYYGYVQACEDFLEGIRKRNKESGWQQGRQPKGTVRSYSEAAGTVFTVGECPECGDLVATPENYCKNCGAKLDWGCQGDGK